MKVRVTFFGVICMLTANCGYMLNTPSCVILLNISFNENLKSRSFCILDCNSFCIGPGDLTRLLVRTVVRRMFISENIPAPLLAVELGGAGLIDMRSSKVIEGGKPAGGAAGGVKGVGAVEASERDDPA